MVYALNAKNTKLRFFINPNLIRLHDFLGGRKETSWNYSGVPRRKLAIRSKDPGMSRVTVERFLGYYLRGGLSRLNIVFAPVWESTLFGSKIIYDRDHIRPVVSNLLEFYPIPKIGKTQAYVALLVKFGLELIRKSRENDILRNDLINEVGSIISGNHYRNIMEYLNQKSNDHNLFFNEIFKVGEMFYKKEKYLDEFSSRKELEELLDNQFKEQFKDEMDNFGSVYYHTFGILRPVRYQMFPQEMAILFDSGSTSGELINEFKIKVAYHSYKKNIHPYLIGELLYQHLTNTVKKFYSQNHFKDYYSTYFIFDIFNNSSINKTVKRLQKKGYLKIQ